MPDTKEISIPQIITWCINIFVGIGLSIGAWYFNGMNENVKELRNEVGALKIQVTLLQSTKGEVDFVKAQIVAYIASNTEQIKKMAVVEEQLKSLDRRVDAWERGRK